MPYPYHKVLLEAVERSGRSARDISLAAVGHESAVRSLRRGLDMRVSTVEGLCRELGLELHVGPPRHAGSAPTEHGDAPVPVIRGAPSASSERALVELLDAIAQTWRTAPTSWQRGLLIKSLASNRGFFDDWFAEREQVVAGEFDPEEMRRPPPGGPAPDGCEED